MANTKKQISRKSGAIKSVTKSKSASRWLQSLSAFKPEWMLFICLVIFLCGSIYLINDYGLNIDSGKNFREGRANLEFLLTGELNMKAIHRQMHGAFIGMMGDLSKRLLHDKFKIYDPASSRQVILPFLTTLFLFYLFFFVKRHWGGLHGIVSVGFLLSFPYFWGNVFTNQKDIPLLIFISLSLMSFVEWCYRYKLRYFYGFFICWGLALSVKLYALIVPAILILWILIRPVDNFSREKTPWQQLCPHAISGFAISLVIVLTFYMPAFWGVESKLNFLIAWQNEVKSITTDYSKSFNIVPFVQIFFRTPVLFLPLAIFGIIFAIRHYRKHSVYSLFLIWLIFPVLIPCFPGTTFYTNGMRLYLLFLVPWAFFATLGLFYAVDFLNKKFRLGQKSLVVGLAALIIATNLYGVIETHPYQTTFFNTFAGGLGGAQKKGLPDAGDYWCTYYREAGKWLTENGEANANILALNKWISLEHAETFIGRPDLNTYVRPFIPSFLQPNTYVIYTPGRSVRTQGMLLELSGDFEKVYQVKRQGGEIFSIYYRPPLPVWLNK